MTVRVTLDSTATAPVVSHAPQMQLANQTASRSMTVHAERATVTRMRLVTWYALRALRALTRLKTKTQSFAIIVQLANTQTRKRSQLAHRVKSSSQALQGALELVHASVLEDTSRIPLEIALTRTSVSTQTPTRAICRLLAVTQ